MIGAENGAKVNVRPRETRIELYIDDGNINESFLESTVTGVKLLSAKIV